MIDKQLAKRLVLIGAQATWDLIYGDNGDAERSLKSLTSEFTDGDVHCLVCRIEKEVLGKNAE